MKEKVEDSQFTQQKNNRTSQLFDENQQIIRQLKLISLPENFVSKNQIKSLVSQVNEGYETESNGKIEFLVC
ncbi:unnamed protein product [Didymodactylos carnosus]|uniref:Uncharacterized protein n=1 Tax=Didymodactylos carnosus TaxID=1234261 RepID=A0A813UEF7_9BILA|nr:unnamed protein product [Didymodactylos carnosus]CAF1499062.1 unnamed protein product [Didymodactylos carnosus]CAF3608764.1 unnamed protein product [Didymodactylos carnosus]CAF4287688.1 unnamed protein product [Didymodactylos carnosus]